MRFSKKIIFPLMAAIILGVSVPAFAAQEEGDSSSYTAQDGTTFDVDRKAITVKAREEAKRQGIAVSSLSRADWDKIASEVRQLSDDELEEIYDDLANGKAFGDLSDEEMAALRDAYEQSTWGTSSGETDGESGPSDEDRSRAGTFAFAGILGGSGIAAGMGLARRRGISMFGGIPKPKKAKVEQNPQDVSVLNTTEENMALSGFPDLTLAEAEEGYNYIDFYCDDWDGVSESTKEFAYTVAAAWQKLHPGIGNLLVTSGKREGGGGSHHDYGEAFDVANDYFDDKSLRDDYVNLVAQLGGTPLDEWSGEPGAVYAHGDNIHATTPNSAWGNGGSFSYNSLL